MQVLVWLVWLTFGFSYYGTILILPQVLPLPNSSTGNGNGTNTTAASVYTSITPGGGGYNAGIYQDGDTVRDAMLCGNSRTLLRFTNLHSYTRWKEHLISVLSSSHTLPWNLMLTCAIPMTHSDDSFR